VETHFSWLAFSEEGIPGTTPPGGTGTAREPSAAPWGTGTCGFCPGDALL
jgi:hypothetical protein